MPIDRSKQYVYLNDSGDDADIICGEWQTGDTPRNSSAEEYNIILEIKSITRHPDYTVNFEPSFLSNDIAIFKVDDEPLAPVSKKPKFRDTFVDTYLKGGHREIGIISGLSATSRTTFSGRLSLWMVPGYSLSHIQKVGSWIYRDL